MGKLALLNIIICVYVCMSVNRCRSNPLYNSTQPSTSSVETKEMVMEQKQSLLERLMPDIQWGLVMYLIPIMIILGIIGNIFNLFIFYHPSFPQNPGNFWLKALAVSDLLVLVSAIRWVFKFTDDVKAVSFFMKFGEGIFRQLSAGIFFSFFCVGTWCQCALGVERLIVISFPLKHYKILTNKVRYITFAFILLIPSVVGIVYTITVGTKDIWVKTGNATILVDVIEFPTPLLYNDKFKEFLRIYRFIVSQPGPVVCLAIISLLIVLKIQQAHNRRRHLVEGQDNSVDEQKSTLGRLFAVIVITTFILKIPELVHLGINSGQERDAVAELFYTLYFTSFIFNVSLNFYVYVIFSDKYREVLKIMLHISE